LVAIDVSGDGKLDLINTNLVMVGNGDGTFRVPVPYAAGGQVVADFNSDGIGDFGSAGGGYMSETVMSLYLSLPRPDFFPTALNFGAERVGSTSPPKKIKLTNIGNAPLKLSSITVTGDFLETNNCGKRRSIGKSCTIQVTFKPKARGVRTGLVTIADNASGSPQKLHLKGTGH